MSVDIRAKYVIRMNAAKGCVDALDYKWISGQESERQKRHVVGAAVKLK